MKIKTIISILFCILSYQLFSQDIKNRKFNVNYESAFTMGALVSKQFVFHHKLNFEYSLGKYFSINVNGSISAAKYNGNKSGKIENLNDKLVGARLIYYRQKEKSISPVGRYYSVGYYHGTQNKFYEEEFQTDPNSDVFTRYVMNNDTKVPLQLVSLGFGRNFVFGNRILFGYGFEFCFQMNKAHIENFSPYDLRHLFKPSIKIGMLL